MNIVVICSDTFRYDHLGFTKREPVITPNLDRLALESAHFRDFWLCSFPTLVNRIEVFSGRTTFPLMDWGPQPYRFPVLAEIFRHHGFKTGLIADNPHLMNKGFRFGRGFDFVKDVPGQAHDEFQPASSPAITLPCPEEKLEPAPKRLARYRRNAYYYQQQGTNTTEIVFKEAMQWLNAPPEKFFLWVDAFDPHEPWDAPQRYLDLYPWDKNADKVFWPHSGKTDRYTPGELANMRSLYKAEITQTDLWVGKLLDHLRDKELLDNTAVIFLSDHGYYFGEHGLLGKPLRQKIGIPIPIYEALGHIPLLVRHPKGLAAGQSIPGICQPIDVTATLLDLAGIPKEQWLQGESLVPRLSEAKGGRKFAIGGCHPRGGKVSCLSVWTDEWCLVYSPFNGLEGSELFDQRADPKHEKNLIAENRAVAQQLFDILCGWLNELKVPPARQKQFLHAAEFPRFEKIKHWLWMRRNQFSYWMKFRNYDPRR